MRGAFLLPAILFVVPMNISELGGLKGFVRTSVPIFELRFHPILKPELLLKEEHVDNLQIYDSSNFSRSKEPKNNRAPKKAPRTY